ncbi:hypothetical protein P7C71_g1950, partial [Lecanoromycetidae sp. Uapishka_2]
MTFKLTERPQDPSAKALHQFKLPDASNKLGIRLYDTSVSVEIWTHPIVPKQHKSKRRAPQANGDCWMIHLDVAMKPDIILVESKGMLRRLEATTLAMPFTWFNYRNYFVEHAPGSQPSSDVQLGDVFVQNFLRGYTWKFTGNLASEVFRQELGGESVDQAENTDVEKSPRPNKKRQEPRKTIAKPKTAQGKKAAKKLPAKDRRLERVRKRSMGLVPESSPEASSPEVMSEASSEASEYEVESLLAKRMVEGQLQYQVK